MIQVASIARIVLILPALLLTLSLSARAQTEMVTLEDGKSRLLESLLHYTTWPGEEQMDSFVLGLYGRDRLLLRTLRRDMANVRVRGKLVQVTQFNDLAAARSAHMLVLAPSENSQITEITGALRGSQTLIVSDAHEDTSEIMVNFIHPSKSRLSFEINRSNIIAAGLQPSKDLLLFGGSRVDLAEVYEETEAELARAREIADQQERELQKQRNLLAQQGSVIATQRAEMSANQQALDELRQQLTGINAQLEASEGRLRKNADVLLEKEAVLAEKEAYIDAYSSRIERNQKRLQAQQSEIEEQQAQIAEQDEILASQMGTIEAQRFVLIAAAAILMLVLTLIVVVLRGYRSKHRLAMQLEGKTRELRVANEKLVQVTEAKSRFLSSMSHEIRTPMNGVIGMAELLEGTDLSAQQSEYVSLIIKSADTLLGLINDILDVSKIEAGRLDLEAIDFNLREVLGDTLQTLALRANEKGLELTFHIPPDVPERIIGDPLRLRQVVVNLVGNAIKFTDAGEVDVDLQLESLSEDAVRILFEVRDTGIGISESQRENVFRAFGQADSSTTRQFGGSGLGLAIARQLTEMMGGQLDVRSELGRGSTFFFSADFALPDEPAPQPVRPQELDGLRVLVVDDNETNSMILEELVLNWGMQATVARSGAAALEAFEAASEPYALALLDVMMPNMDGFELAERIRRMPDGQDLRILMLTSAGRSNTDDIRERLDISRVLLKPVKQSDLLQAITTALGGGAVPAVQHSEQEPVEARRILLVEDNPVNRKVAVELLTRRGHRVEVVNNGAEAVQAVAESAFDVVLMDVHMPVMDGLEATQIIRDKERHSGEHLPIVALTAGATVQDRENSLAVGMNNFVTKPFRAGELFEVVEGFEAGALQQLPEPAVPEPPRADEPEPCLDPAGALRNLEGDEEFLLELSEMFLTQCPALQAAVEESVRSGDGEALRNAAHALKGSAQVIGGRAVAAAALQLERLGREGNLADAVPALHDLQAKLAELKAALAGTLERGEA